jgi:hypothetical protein
MKVFITDITGRQVLKFELPESNTSSFGDALEPGIYFLKLVQGNYMQIVKVMKE